MTGPAKSAAGRTILVADDDMAARLIMREVLEQAGFVVVEAQDGVEACAVYESVQPDLILLDVEMPHLDGFSVCQKIRASETTRQTPICIVTGLEDEGSIDKAYRVGATDFISKPISWPVLPHRVRYLLRAGDARNELNGLVLALPDAVFVLDAEGVLISESSPVATADGNETSVTQLAFDEMFSSNDRSHVARCVVKALDSGEAQIYEHSLDDQHYLETRIVARDRNSAVAIVRDVTDRKESELRIYDLAYYDRLTGLPNRQHFVDELEEIIRSTIDEESPFAVLFIDLDHFKRINDTLGHAMGDVLLKSVAERLVGCIRSTDELLNAESFEDNIKIARLGGDEFVVMLRDVASESTASTIAMRAIDALTQPFDCDGHQFVITPSIGIAMYPDDGGTSDELLTNADLAMYRAKAAGRNNFQFFSGTMKIQSINRLDIENELRKAIETEQFELHYQPKVDLHTWQIVGAEALLRWDHPERGWIGPDRFIPVAEDTGLILPLGDWVIRQACMQLRAWQDTALHDILVSVNVSGQQMYSNEILSAVENAVTAAGVDPARLELEITESMLMQDVEDTIVTLEKLRNLGVALSVDDFGTGYSSLSYLKRLPIDTLKIDRSFVRDLHEDSDDAAICAAIMAMAQQLELSVVAEGVELEAQLEFLRQHHCNLIQGYFFSKPLPVKEFEKLFATHAAAKNTATA